MGIIVTILAFLFVFGLLVLVHELGHFLAARLMGVTVNSFAFGFPPTLYKKKVGDTEYKINAIPLGGYVTMLGEDDSTLTDSERKKAEKEPGSLQSKEPWQVIVIMFAGVIMNVVLAIALFFICYTVGFQPIVSGADKYAGIVNDMKVKITEVEKDTPAQKAGLQASDYIISVDGHKVHTSDEVVSTISAKADPATSLTRLEIQRGSTTLEKQVTAYKSQVKLADGTVQNVSRIGITLDNIGTVHGGFVASLSASIQMVWNVTVLTFEGIVSLFRQLIFHFQISNQVSGPVGIIVMTNYFAQLGFVPLLQFAAILSISLAIFNILPIPALDGGQIFVTVIEMLMRRKFTAKSKNTVQLIGFAFIIGLFVIITVKDLFNFGIIKSVTGWF